MKKLEVKNEMRFHLFRDSANMTSQILRAMHAYPFLSKKDWAFIIAVIAKISNYSDKDHRRMRAICQVSGTRLSKSAKDKIDWMLTNKVYETRGVLDPSIDWTSQS